jgi:hypothetical protein
MNIFRFACTWVLVLSVLCVQDVLALSDPPAPPVNTDNPAPFQYVLGRTTLSEAVSYWRASGARILRSGHLALGTGSGLDGVGKTSADKVVLVDLAGIDFEGIPSARFGFYEERLYLIQATLKPGLLSSKTDLAYDTEQMKALEQRLRKEYGRPLEQRSGLMKKSEPADVLSWNVGGNSLRFVSNPLNGSLVLTNEQTQANIRRYVKEYCKTVNTPGHIICW